LNKQFVLTLLALGLVFYRDITLCVAYSLRFTDGSPG